MELSSQKLRVVHLSSVHSRNDARIFYKMCKSLSKEVSDVYLVIADGKGNEVKDNVSIIDVGLRDSNRFLRMTKTVYKVFKEAKKINGNIYHLHDPELITIGLKLQKSKKVIFDAHEDYVEKIVSRKWINPNLSKIISFFFNIFYKYSIKKFDGIVLAADTIKINNHKKIIFRNLPDLKFKTKEVTKKTNDNIVLYTGGITEYRGIEQVIKALIYSKFKNWKLVILGKESLKLRKKLEHELEDSRISYLGQVSYDEVVEWIKKSNLGVVINQPVFSYDKSLPNKLFEYMAYGLPVVCSNFDHWKEIVVKNNAGICCNPTDLFDITQSIEKILSNKKLQNSMSINGKEAIKTIYSLEKETLNLIKFYKEIINEK